MNAEIKRRWIEALTSGKYKQGTMTLHGGDAFCCLGVLCDLYATDHGLAWSEGSDAGTLSRQAAVLPIEVVRWAGLFGNSPVNLAIYNDDGMTFVNIAKIIEAEL